MKKIGIVCCSNGQNDDITARLKALETLLKEMDITPVYADCIKKTDQVRSAPAKQRAAALMEFYNQEAVEAVYDISGGDIANEILPYLDYETIAKSKVIFYGYSDLTTVLNAIYAKTGKESGLYQIMNLIKPLKLNEHRLEWVEREEQRRYFEHRQPDFSYHFLKGKQLEGIMVGGNVRCFLKLAGTEYFPDLQGKILLLEALGGEIPQSISYLSQLSQIGAFQKINGILLGTFTRIEEMGMIEQLYREVLQFADGLPVAVTSEIGHGTNAKCCMIGRRYQL